MSVSGEVVITEINFLGNEEMIEQAAEIYANSVIRQIKEKKQEEYRAKEVEK